MHLFVLSEQLIPRVFTVFTILALNLSAYSQYAQRIEGHFVIKKVSNLESSLTIGDFYYDINSERLIYDITFPEHRIIVFADSVIYLYANHRLFKKEKNALPNKYKIFHFALEGKLSDFGLPSFGYQKINFNVDKGVLITEWQPMNNSGSELSMIITAQEDKLLTGVVLYNKKGELISKQNYKLYKSFDGLMFPMEIMQIGYFDNIEVKQLISFKDIEINNYDSKDAMYKYNMDH